MNKKRTTQSARGGKTGALELLNRLHTPGARHAMTPREQTMNHLTDAFSQCRGLVGLVAQTGSMLRAENVAAAGQTDAVLQRTSNALLRDLKKFNEELSALAEESENLKHIKDDYEYLPEGIVVGQKLTDWQERFRNVVLPLNGQVHDRIEEIVTAEEEKGAR